MIRVQDLKNFFIGSRAGSRGGGKFLAGSVPTYADLPTPASSYVGKIFFVQNPSQGFLSFVGVYKYPKGLYTPNSSNVWELIPINVKVSEDAISQINITDWPAAFEYFFDMSIGDRVIYQGETYVNLTGTITPTAPDTDTTNWQKLQYNLSNTVWVSSTGNDIHGQIGNINKPYQTIQAAINAITTASPTNEFIINVDAGRYNENVILKSNIHLKGSSLKQTVIYSSTGPVLTLPTGNCSVNNIQISLEYPTLTDQVVIGNAGSGGVHYLISYTVQAIVVANDVFARLMDLASDTFIATDGEIIMFNAGTNAINTDHTLINFNNPAGVLGLPTNIYNCQYYPPGSANITAFNFNTGNLIAIGQLSAYHQMLAPALTYTGNTTMFKFNLPNAAAQGIYSAQIGLFAPNGATGIGRIVETTYNGAQIITFLSTTCEVLGFIQSSLAKTNYVGNEIDFNISIVSPGITWDDSAGGTVNVNIIQDSKFKVNTDIIDLNALIGNPTNQGLREFINIGFSAGWVSEAVLTDNLDGTVDISSGTGMIRNINDEQAPLFSFDHLGVTNLTLTTDAENYIYIDYNAGNPQIQVTLNTQDILENENDKYELYEIYKEGATTLHITDHRQRSKNIGGKIQQYLYSKEGISRANSEGGLILGESGDINRYVTVSGGKVWIKLVDIIITEINTNPINGDTFDGYYRDGVGGWTKQTGLTQWNFTQWDNNSGTLQTIAANRYCYNDYWLSADNKLVFIYPQNTYTTQVSAAEAPLPSNLPDYLGSHSLYIGRIVFQESTTPSLEVLSAFDITLSSAGATDHGNLSGLGDDDHTQYALLSGRSGGQSISLGTDSGDIGQIESTSNATKGDLKLQPNGGNVSIGATLASNILTIGDDLNLATSKRVLLGSASENTSYHAGQSGTNNILMAWTYNSTPANAYGFLATFGYNNDFYIDGKTLILQNNSSGNVGINLTNPSHKLEVNGSIALARTEKFQFKETPGGVDGAYIASNSTNDLLLGPGGTDRFWMKANGQLAIVDETTYITRDGSNNLSFTDAITGTKTLAELAVGEANTASNAGTGASLFFQKTGVDLEFNGIKSENDRLSVTLDGVSHDIELTLNEANIDHNNINNLNVGDVHTQYLLLDGRSGGQIAYGGTQSGDNLIFNTTTNVTKGDFIFQNATRFDIVALNGLRIKRSGTPGYLAPVQDDLEAAYIYVDDNDVWFVSEQDENSGGRGGFKFVMDDDGTQVPYFSIGLKNGGVSYNQVFFVDSSGSVFSSNRVYFLDSSTYITRDGSNNLSFTDAITGTKTLAELFSGGGGVTDHGALTGLLDDDHTQYLLLAGRGSPQTIIGIVNFNNYINSLGGISTNGSDTSEVFGYGAAPNEGTNKNNSIFGFEAGASLNSVYSDDSNSLFGYWAGHHLGTHSTLASISNVFIGTLAGSYLDRASTSVLIGLAVAGSTATTRTCDYNIGIGYRSIYAIDEGEYNVVIDPFQAGYNLTTGSYNTLVGPYRTGIDLITGSYNTLLGRVDSGLSSSQSNTVILADGQGDIRFFSDSSKRIGLGTSSINSSAKVQIDSTTEGFLPPRMTTTQRNAISSPAVGLIIYNTTIGALQRYNGAVWERERSVSIRGIDTDAKTGTFNGISCSGGTNYTSHKFFNMGQYSAAANNARVCTLHLPYDFTPDTQFSVEVHWTHLVGTGNVFWGVGVLPVDSGDSIDGTEYYGTGVSNSTGVNNKAIFSASFSNATFEADDTLGIVVYREYNNVLDTLGNSSFVLNIVLRYWAKD